MHYALFDGRLSKSGVLTHSHIAETDHSLHMLSEVSGKNAGGL